jgi:cobalamin biosynthesis protein CobD/CbiB
MKPNKSITQILWGAALVLAGIGVIFRIPRVLPQVFNFAQFSAIKGFIYFCFYFMAIVLIAGGAQKIYRHTRALKRDRKDQPGLSDNRDGGQ